MRLCELTLEEAAKEAKGNWRKFDSFAWHDRPDDCGEWVIVYTHNRDSGLIDQSNAAVVAKALKPFADDIRPEHHGHWACGWVDGYAIRVYRNGEITPAFRKYHELAERLADYPILDESDYSNREYQATIENFKQEGYNSDEYNPPEDWPSEVFSWLWDHNEAAVENRDDQGGYATRKQIHEAMDALAYRITWAVSYIDVGETTEIFDSEHDARDRTRELRGQGVLASYDLATTNQAHISTLTLFE